MPPEFIDLIKTFFSPMVTAVGGLILGRSWRKAKLESLIQQNKNLEFDRLKGAMDELQQENRDYRKELRDLRGEMQSMREQHAAEMRSMREQHAAEMQSMRDQAARERESYLKRITELEGQVAHLESKLAEAKGTGRSKIAPAIASKEGL